MLSYPSWGPLALRRKYLSVSPPYLPFDPDVCAVQLAEWQCAKHARPCGRPIVDSMVQCIVVAFIDRRFDEPLLQSALRVANHAGPQAV